MSAVLQKKVRSFLAAQYELQAKYRSILDVPKNTQLAAELTLIHEYDQLVYSFTAIKTYYDLSKSRWESDHRNQMDEFETLNSRITDKLPIADLYEECPELAVIRREYKELAREGGKLAHLLIASSSDLSLLHQLTSDFAGFPSLSPTPAASKAPGPKAAPKEKTPAKAAPSEESPQPKRRKLQSSLESLSPKPAQPAPRPAQTKPKKAVIVVDVDEPSDGETEQRTQNTQKGITDTQATPSTSASPEAPTTKDHKPKVAKRDSSSDSDRPRSQQSTPLASEAPELTQLLSPQTVLKDASFSKFPTWTREHVHILVNAALSVGLGSNEFTQDDAICLAIRRRFNISITRRAAEALRLHYGLTPNTMDNYKYYIQAFDSVAAHYYANRNYVTTPWAELRNQFNRNTGRIWPDWEVKQRYYLFELHQKVYGKQGEPSSNYADIVATYKKTIRQAPDKSVAASAQQKDAATLTQMEPGSPLQFEQEPVTTTKSSIWPQHIMETLVEGAIKVPNKAKNRIQQVVQYIKVRSGFEASEPDVKERLSWASVKRRIEMGRLEKERAAKSKASKAKTEPLSSSDVVDSIHKPITVQGNQFNKLLAEIRAKEDSHPTWFYNEKFPPTKLTNFWTLGRTVCIWSTIEFLSRRQTQVDVPTMMVAKQKLHKIIMLRLLREHKLRVSESSLNARILRMMELDLFDPLLCQAINEYWESVQPDSRKVK